MIKEHDNTVITDLPGIYSMSLYTNEEIVTREIILPAAGAGRFVCCISVPAAFRDAIKSDYRAFFR